MGAIAAVASELGVDDLEARTRFREEDALSERVPLSMLRDRLESSWTTLAEMQVHFENGGIDFELTLPLARARIQISAWTAPKHPYFERVAAVVAKHFRVAEREWRFSHDYRSGTATYRLKKVEAPALARALRDAIDLFATGVSTTPQAGGVREPDVEHAFAIRKGQIPGQHHGPVYALQARHICQDLDLWRRRLAEIERDIEGLLEAHEVGKLLTSIDGLGPHSAARIVAAVGDPARFNSAAAFAAYVGVVPGLSQSGKREGAPRRRGAPRQCRAAPRPLDARARRRAPQPLAPRLLRAPARRRKAAQARACRRHAKAPPRRLQRRQKPQAVHHRVRAGAGGVGRTEADRACSDAKATCST